MPSPIGHSTGFNYGLRFALFHGLKLVLQDGWDARDAERLISAEGCSYTLAATTFLQDLVENLEASGKQLPFRCFGCGGAPVPPELVERAQRVGIQVLRLYGSTEVLVASWNRPAAPLQKRKLSDGQPLSQVEMEIRGADGSIAARGEPGEIYVRGPNTSVGFFNDSERTAKTYDAAGWVRSGDMAIMDDEGFISIVGRQKEIIIRGGLNIAPREIEDVLLSFPEVERAAVLPLADERLGERCCAVVVFRAQQQFDFKQMLERLERTGMAKYKWPERLVAISAMPTTASGKIQKHRIVDLLEKKQRDADDEIHLLSDSGIS
jgi:acyl-CoA synthetase (AMP-forming)/AMP-acid ligase II